MTYWHKLLVISAKMLVLSLVFTFANQQSASAACGDPNQRVCKIGFKCKIGTAEVRGFCKPCGEHEQPACQARQKGKPCHGHRTENINGTCQRRGGTNEKPFTGIGPDCMAGLNVHGGVCKPCGKLGQVECEAERAGKRCNEGLKSEGLSLIHI